MGRAFDEMYTINCIALGSQEQVEGICHSVIDLFRKNELSYHEAEIVLECTKALMRDIKL